MPIVIQRYQRIHEPAVKEFNRRLRAGNAPSHFVFPEHHEPRWLPETDSERLFNRMYVAVDGDAVRGAYVLKHQEFAFRGRIRSMAYLHHPFSEGIVDTRYSLVGIQLIQDAVRRHPLLHALGMDGYESTLARMLLAMRWGHFPVPFYFRVQRPVRFLRRMRILRTPWWRRWLVEVAAVTGAGYVGFRALQKARALTRGSDRGITYDIEPDFGDWSDGVWQAANEEYEMTAVRDGDSLRTLYADVRPQVSRLRVRRGASTIGWAVIALDHDEDHPRYGDLRVGKLLDGFAAPEHARAVVSCATAELRARGADVMVSNQSHQAWCEALEAAGYTRGPSNFIFAAASEVCALLEPLEQTKTSLHLNRADGDGLYQYV